MITEIGFVTVAVTDMPRAREFYEGVLELKPTTEMMEGVFVEYELGPHTLALGCHPEWKPSEDGTSVTFEVDDFEGDVAKLKERGVSFIMGPLETPVCHMAVFRDPDGNKLLIHKRKSG